MIEPARHVAAGVIQILTALKLPLFELAEFVLFAALLYRVTKGDIFGNAHGPTLPSPSPARGSASSLERCPHCRRPIGDDPANNPPPAP